MWGTAPFFLGSDGAEENGPVLTERVDFWTIIYMSPIDSLRGVCYNKIYIYGVPESRPRRTNDGAGSP